MNEAALVLRFAAALATIAAVLWGIAAAVRFVRPKLAAFGSGGTLAVRETVPLAHGAALHLVSAGSALLLVGSAPGGVSLIAPIEQTPSEGP